MLAGAAVLGFGTGVVPRWWAIVSALVAVVLVIGPIGWAALIFGIPVWTLVTSVLLMREPREVRRTETFPSQADRGGRSRSGAAPGVCRPFLRPRPGT